MEGILEFAFLELSVFCLCYYTLGAYLGLLFDAKYFRGTPRNIHETTLLKSIARWLVSLIYYTPFIGLTIMYYTKVTRPVVKIIVFYSVFPFCDGFIWYAFSRKLYTKLGLVSQDLDMIARK